MDPNATLRMILDAIRTDDWDTAGESASDLLAWMRAGGFHPDDMSRVRVWVVTESTPGCLIESDPILCRTRADAINAAADIRRELADSGWDRVTTYTIPVLAFTATRSDAIDDIGRHVVITHEEGTNALEALAR